MISYIHFLTFYAATINHVCIDTHSQKRQWLRICGSFDIGLAHVNLNDIKYSYILKYSYIFMPLIKGQTLDVYVKTFQMMYSHECHMNKFELLPKQRYEKVHRYCGHLPPWNESINAVGLMIYIKLRWTFDDVAVSLTYTLRTAHEYTRKTNIFRSGVIHETFLALSVKDNYKIVLYVHVKYEMLVQILRSNIIGSGILDGPELLCTVLRGQVSSSHQLLVISSSSEKMHGAKFII